MKRIDAIIKPKQAKLRVERVASFVPETIPSITKPESEKTPYDKWITWRTRVTMAGQDRTAITDLARYNDPDKPKYDQLIAELRKFDNLNPGNPRISGMFELGPEAPENAEMFDECRLGTATEVVPRTPQLRSPLLDGDLRNVRIEPQRALNLGVVTAGPPAVTPTTGQNVRLNRANGAAHAVPRAAGSRRSACQF